MLQVGVGVGDSVGDGVGDEAGKQLAQSVIALQTPPQQQVPGSVQSPCPAHIVGDGLGDGDGIGHGGGLALHVQVAALYGGIGVAAVA